MGSFCSAFAKWRLDQCLRYFSSFHHSSFERFWHTFNHVPFLFDSDLKWVTFDFLSSKLTLCSTASAIHTCKGLSQWVSCTFCTCYRREGDLSPGDVPGDVSARQRHHDADGALRTHACGTLPLYELLHWLSQGHPALRRRQVFWKAHVLHPGPGPWAGSVPALQKGPDGLPGGLLHLHQRWERILFSNNKLNLIQPTRKVSDGAGRLLDDRIVFHLYLIWRAGHLGHCLEALSQDNPVEGRWQPTQCRDQELMLTKAKCWHHCTIPEKFKSPETSVRWFRPEKTNPQVTVDWMRKLSAWDKRFLNPHIFNAGSAK